MNSTAGDEAAMADERAVATAASADAAEREQAFWRRCAEQAEAYMRRVLDDPEDEVPQAAARRQPRGPAPGAICGARLRDGSLCPRPPVEGRRRCRSHGCAPRTGAPKGNRNALKDGLFTAKEIARRRRFNAFIRECLQTLRDVDEMMKEGG
jgi:hypothetical protein